MVGNQQCNCKGRGLTALLCTIHRCALRVYPKPPKSSRSQLYTVGIVLSSLCRIFKICTLRNVEKTGFYIAMAKNFCVGKMFFVRLWHCIVSLLWDLSKKGEERSTGSSSVCAIRCCVVTVRSWRALVCNITVQAWVTTMRDSTRVAHQENWGASSQFPSNSGSINTPQDRYYWISCRIVARLRATGASLIHFVWLVWLKQRQNSDQQSTKKKLCLKNGSINTPHDRYYWISCCWMVAGSESKSNRNLFDPFC